MEGGNVAMDAISTAIQTVISAISSDITIGNVATLIATALSVAIPFVLFWFGYRFLTRKAISAFKKGKI